MGDPVRTLVAAVVVRRMIKVAAVLLVVGVLVGMAAWAARSPGVTTAAEVLSTLLSALALAGVAGALYYQALQTEITRLDVARNQRADLMLFAIEHPELLEAWGYRSDNLDRAKLQIYASVVFAYLSMAYEVGRITNYELRFTCERVFANETIATWWDQMARDVYLNQTVRPFGRQDFAQIVDQIHRARPPVSSNGSTEPDPHP